MWTRIKPTERALEKLIRSYDCDVSRLLDCCRQSIVFERLEDLLCCLQAIDCDEELQIVRLKNRLDEGYDARFSGGFRYRLTVRFFCSKSLAKMRFNSVFFEIVMITTFFGFFNGSE